MKKYPVGQIVRIVFLDHVEDGDEALEFEVFGRIMKQTKKFTTLGAWIFTKEPNTAGDENIKTWCIVNRAIKKIKPLN